MSKHLLAAVNVHRSEGNADVVSARPCFGPIPAVLQISHFKSAKVLIDKI